MKCGRRILLSEHAAHAHTCPKACGWKHGLAKRVRSARRVGARCVVFRVCRCAIRSRRVRSGRMDASLSLIQTVRHVFSAPMQTKWNTRAYLPAPVLALLQTRHVWAINAATNQLRLRGPG